MKTLHIYLFRHGQSTYNRDHKFTGFHDPGLTEKGKKEAKTIARKLKNKQFQLAIHTRLKRSKQTLNIVLKDHPECAIVKRDDRMIERNYGNLNGTRHEDFIHRVGKRLIDLEVEGDAIENLSKEKRKKLENFLGKQEYDLIHRGYNLPPPGGESFADVEKRVKPFIRDLLAFMRKNQVSVAISAHGNSIRLFRKIMEKASKEQAPKWIIPYDKVFHYKVKA